MQRVVVFVLASMLTAVSATADDADRPVSPILNWNEAALETFDASWLHVKFTEGSDVRLVAAPTPSGTHFARANDGALVEVNRVVANAIRMRRTFPGDRQKFLDWKRRGEATSGQPGPNLALWFDVEVDGGRVELAAAINALNALPDVEIAHPAPVCEPAVVLSPGPVAHFVRAWPAFFMGTPDFTFLQEYLYDTPVGLDAPSAWAMSGGRGAGMKFIDVEQGWVIGHEDFDPDGLFYEGKENTFGDHGTAVMGEVVGVDNGFGITGFAPDTQWGTVGYDPDAHPEVSHRFLEAVEQLDAGDVWLIEIQMFPPGRTATPMEWLQANYDVIWTSSWALGVICIEAGANGSQNLDDPSWGGIFDREVRDSGAFMVGAGTPTGRDAEGFTNYGSRMDVNAWGSQIVTTGYGSLFSGGSRETEYTGSFGGTSGASPMIAGSALCLQGIAKEYLGGPLWPANLRALLRDTGIDYLGNRNIGPRPDLGAAVAELLSQACPEDVDSNGVTDFQDLLLLLGAWGPCKDCPEDIDRNGAVDFGDVVLLLSAWGPCPLADVGACCFATSCVNVRAETCTADGGVFQGIGTQCQNGCVIPADACADAPIANEGVFPFTTRNATTDGPNLPEECDEGNGDRCNKDVWILYVASCTGTATVSTCDSDFNTRIAVYADGVCPGDVLYCNDDACGDGGTRSEVVFPVQSGETYRIRIGSPVTERGEGTLVIECSE